MFRILRARSFRRYSVIPLPKPANPLVSRLSVVTDFENNNIFVGQMAKALYHVENVIVRVIDKQKEAIYSDMGIRTICPAELSANAVIDFHHRGEAI